MTFARTTFFALTLPIALALGGCGTRTADDRNLDELDNELVEANGAAHDPALTGALHDQIMVDPALTHQANGDAVRPPPQPAAGGVPPESVAAGGAHAPETAPTTSSEQLKHAPDAKGACPNCTARREAVTLAGVAERQHNRRTSACVAKLGYSAGWATKLPGELPLYPDARVTEAAGTDADGCALRIVSFASATPPSTLIDWYYTRATRAGFGAEHQADAAQHVLGGTRARDGAAYVGYFTPRRDGGTDVDLIVDTGR